MFINSKSEIYHKQIVFEQSLFLWKSCEINCKRLSVTP